MVGNTVQTVSHQFGPSVGAQLEEPALGAVVSMLDALSKRL